MFDFSIKVVGAYLLGSLLGSLIVGKLRGGVDIRTLGSGNAGGTNALRTQGVWFALAVMVIDIGKGWIAAALLPNIGSPDSDALLAGWLPVACATGAVLGHVYPIWFDFRGGKGAATLIGVVLGLSPVAALPTLAIWLLVLLLSGYVGLATMCATCVFPFYAKWWLHSDQLLVFGIVMTLFVVYTHRSNILRMCRGTEHRATRMWLLRPR